MRTYGLGRPWLALAILTGAGLLTDASGCGGASSTVFAPGDDGGQDSGGSSTPDGASGDGPAANDSSTVDATVKDSASDALSSGDVVSLDSTPGDATALDATAGDSATADSGVADASDSGVDSALEAAADGATGADGGPAPDAAGGDGGDGGDAAPPCDAPNGAFVVVDPVDGVDTATGGSDSAGGQPAGACAFKTITYALGHMGAATAVHVMGSTISASANGETFPIVVPAQVTILGVGAVTVDVQAPSDAGTSAGDGFVLSSGGSVLSGLIIDGASVAVHGVLVRGGTTSTTSVDHVEIRNFTQAGIRVQGTGRLTINSGTNIHDNGLTGNQLSGLRVTGTGHADIVGGADPIQFSNNGQDGILVDVQGSVTITGAPGAGATGSVVANNNTYNGIEIAQVVGSGAPACSLTGLVAASNTQDGALIWGGSAATVRASVFVGNGNSGVEIANLGASAAENDVSGIDLGTGNGGNAGHNVLQSTTLPNNLAGLCLNIALGRSQTLDARGNTWVSGGAAVDCSSAAGALTESAVSGSSRPCAGGARDIGGTGLSAVVVAGTANGVRVDQCTCGASTTCR